ncbi:MAG: c-type cytochrome biogenesis protein CcsB [Candidatus Aminicenantes bacterium]|nr:c-type cytochrome biogenesis protein CcsB [Candidatus Aminicenantes bacterium]
MNESFFFGLSFILYIVATIFYFSFLFKQKLSLSRIGTNLALIGLISHTLALVFRTIESGHAPFTNMYESLSFLSWATVLALVIVEKKYQLRAAGAYVLLIVVALMAIASSPLMPKEATPLVPALQSYWLWLHVSVTLLGEGFFAIAFITSLLYLIAEAKTRQGEETTFSPSKLDSLSYRLIAIGFPLFTLGGLIFGMIWAYRAWGSYWSWDPKEVWSLITWFVFALYLHTRLVMGWQGRRSAFIAILGFLAALFTYFGVNYLISGLHSYV